MSKTRIVRHKESGRYAYIVNPDVIYSGVLVKDPAKASIFNPEVDQMTDDDIIKFVASADWLTEHPMVKNLNEDQWELVNVKINVTIE